MRHCPACGNDLGQSESEIDGKHQTSLRLFQRLTDAGHTSPICHFPEADYFRALWSTSRLISRKLDRFIASGKLPCLEKIQSAHIKGWTIERQVPEVRQAIISSAEYLIAKWPARFIQTCDHAKVSRSDFGGTDNCSPTWFDDVVRHQLAKSVNWITREDVSKAVTEIKAQGLAVSKNSVRRKLGITESWAINEILDQRRKATCDELAILCLHYRDLIEHTPPSRDQQRTLCRDFLILLVTTLSGENVEKVCRMTEAEIEGHIHRGRSIAKIGTHGDTIFNTLSDVLDQYKSGIRSEFALRAKDAVPYWFLTRFGKAMDGHSVRERFAKIMKNLFEPKLWNSMDVFLTSLSGPEAFFCTNHATE